MRGMDYNEKIVALRSFRFTVVRRSSDAATSYDLRRRGLGRRFTFSGL